MDFNSISSLMKYLNTNILASIQKIGNEIKGVLKNTVNKEWYQRPDFDVGNSQYLRTMQLLDSITLSPVVSSGNTYTIQIYYDTSLITPMDGTDKYPWTKHKSIVNGSSSSEQLPYYIEFGNGDSSIYSYEGVHPVQKTIDWAKEDRYLLYRFKELLESKGFVCVMG